MSRAAVLVIWKQHRVELAMAIGILVVLTVWAAFGVLSAAAQGVAASCFALLNGTDPGSWGDCGAPLYAWERAHIGGSDLYRQMIEFVPFGASALVGVPIVARELEGRTAAIAWSLEPSRGRWLRRQGLTIGLTFGFVALALSIAASFWEHDWDVWGGGGAPDVTHIGHYGPGLLARMFAAFGVAVAVGALVGRQLPAFLLAFVLMLPTVSVLAGFRDGWFASHPAQVLNGPGVATDWAWQTPTGTVISKQDAAHLPPPDTDAETWLETNGYAQVPVGISIATAMGWAPYEAAAYVGLALVSLGVAALATNRRRPT